MRTPGDPVKKSDTSLPRTGLAARNPAPRLPDTVFLGVDCAVPVGAIRRTVAAILDGTPLRDRRVQAVQVNGLSCVMAGLLSRPSLP